MEGKIYSLLQTLLVTPIVLISVYLLSSLAYDTVKNWNYFQKNQIRIIRGWPLLGALHKFFFGQLSNADLFIEIYNRFPNEKVIGFYQMLKPMYMLRDPDLIKLIGITDFDNFINRNHHFNKALDPMLTKGLPFIKDQAWRDMRALLSPVFTSSKIKLMLELVTDTVDEFIRFIKINGERDYDAKDLFSKLTIDIFASTSFGLEINSLVNPENEFYKQLTQFLNIGGLKGIKMFVINDNYPKIMKYFRIEIFERTCIEYFRKIITDTINYRKKNDITPPDLINQLIQVRKESKDWTNDDILGQCLTFLFAGNETVSTTFSFMVYELATNLDVQQRLYLEIKETAKSLNGDRISYDVIMNSMKYMECVIHEVLRLWPAIPFLHRQVSKDYSININGKEVILKSGGGVWLPIVGIHRDAKYFPDPLRFDPDRFSDENKSKIHPFAYLPFGLGPRLCIANRMGMLQFKTLLYKLLLDFVIEPCDRTQRPVILKKRTFNLCGEKGIWVKIRPRVD